jgi:hypothetical protein
MKTEITHQEIHWVPESRKISLEKMPHRVWTVMVNYNPDNKPELPMVPQHLHNAFLEDKTHDWAWKNGVLRYFSRVADHSVWILCEYA